MPGCSRLPWNGRKITFLFGRREKSKTMYFNTQGNASSYFLKWNTEGASSWCYVRIRHEVESSCIRSSTSVEKPCIWALGLLLRTPKLAAYRHPNRAKWKKKKIPWKDSPHSNSHAPFDLHHSHRCGSMAVHLPKSLCKNLGWDGYDTMGENKTPAITDPTSSHICSSARVCEKPLWIRLPRKSRINYLAHR